MAAAAVSAMMQVPATAWAADIPFTITSPGFPAQGLSRLLHGGADPVRCHRRPAVGADGKRRAV